MLLNNLKQTVVVLASNAGVLNTVQAAAQAVLQSGWSVLLPTAEERARALSSLLPNAGECIPKHLLTLIKHSNGHLVVHYSMKSKMAWTGDTKVLILILFYSIGK